MCGIAGFWGNGAPTLVADMIDGLAHRGPDGASVVHLGDVQLGATRLAIVDPAAGLQPMSAPEHGVHIAFNGEIYNHRELRNELTRRGHVFRTKCDTEVVLRMYVEHGRRLLEHLRGMYAFAIYDGNEFYLARDPFGIKPLYIARPGGAFAFASEIAPLLRLPDMKRSLDRQAFVDWRVLGYPWGTSTFFIGVESVAPGVGLVVRNGSVVAEVPRPGAGVSEVRTPASLDEAVESVRSAIDFSVSTHLVADVDVALLLSGGVDSSLLALSAAEFSRAPPLRTLTVFDDATHADARLAAVVARAIGSEHHELHLNFQTFVSMVPECIEALEIPAGLGSVPLLHAVKAMRSIGLRCCLIGEGADELFGGYPDHAHRHNLTEAIPSRAAEFAARGLHVSQAVSEALAIIGDAGSPSEYSARVLDFYLGDQLRRLHLDPVDRIGMASGVELRVPYLAEALTDLARMLPVEMKVNQGLGIQKHVLRRVLMQRRPELSDVALRRKVGFPGACGRLTSDLRTLCEKCLPSTVCDPEYAWAFESKLEQLLFALFCERLLGETNNASSYWEQVASPSEHAARRG